MHATVIVALSPEDVSKHGTIEKAVGWQMEPFDMQGTYGDWGPYGEKQTTWDFWKIWRFLGDDMASKMARRDAVQERYRNVFNANAFLESRRWHQRDESWLEAGVGEHPLRADDEVEATLVIHEDERWCELFWDRFIRDLSGDTLLMAVDYHF